MTDVDELVDQFVKREEINFRLFNTINELGASIEDLEDGISTEKQELEKFKTKEDVGPDGRSVLASLERKLQRVNEFMKRDLQASEHATIMLNELRGDVGSLFVQIGCESSLVERLLGVAKILQAESQIVPSVGTIVAGGTIVEKKSEILVETKKKEQTDSKPSTSVAQALAKFDASVENAGTQTQTPQTEVQTGKQVDISYRLLIPQRKYIAVTYLRIF